MNRYYKTNIFNKYILGATSFLFILAIGFVVYKMDVSPSNLKDGQTAKTADNTDFETRVQTPLETTISGASIARSDFLIQPVAIVVENHPDSRPQSGLSQAEIVYEMVAEGGITRTLAIFQRKGIEVGPIRSARPYFADLANGYSSVFAHVGGSPEVLQALRAKKYTKLLDLNEFFNESFFDRIKTRSAPHNAYSTTDRLASFNSQVSGMNSSEEKVNKQSFEFSSVLPQGVVEAHKIEINFSKPAFFSTYNYDAQSQRYIRKVSGVDLVDKNDGSSIQPSTVAVVFTDITNIPGDSEGRMKIRTQGAGKALVFSGGKMQECQWQRKSGEVIQFVDTSDKKIQVLPGQVWISFVSETQVTWE